MYVGKAPKQKIPPVVGFISGEISMRLSGGNGEWAVICVGHGFRTAFF